MAQAKEVTIGGEKYLVGLMGAADGSWVYASFIKRYREYLLSVAKAASNAPKPEEEAPAEDAPPATQEQLEAGFDMAANSLIESLSRTELAEMQAVCLKCCSYLSAKTGTAVWMPILMDDGRFAADLATNGPVCLELTVRAISFNVMPYFLGAGSNSPATPAASSLPPTQR